MFLAGIRLINVHLKKNIYFAKVSKSIMFNIVQKIHSHNRNLILLLLVVVIVLSLYALISKRPWSKANKVLNLVNLIVVDLQFLLGVTLYFGLSRFGIKAFSDPSMNVMKDAMVRKIANSPNLRHDFAISPAPVGSPV